jgi:Ubiquitin-2 like Rad60 SUMO-like
VVVRVDSHLFSSPYHCIVDVEKDEPTSICIRDPVSGLILHQQLFYPDGRRGSGLLAHLEVPDTFSHYRERLQTGDKTYVIVSKDIPMEKVFNAFAKLKGVEVNRIRFLWDGVRIGHFQTPGELQLDVDDAWDGIIDCVMEIVRLIVHVRSFRCKDSVHGFRPMSNVSHEHSFGLD